ncbi:MAG: hypothetical protein PHP25_04030 [Candidatus Moranbacteria bacterium]|nr:hypothetical protein [Candidatus Moranbacteria bacterium]
MAAFFKNTKPKIRQKGEENRRKNKNHHISRLISRINHDFPKKIDEEAKNYILDILEELKIE